MIVNLLTKLFWAQVWHSVRLAILALMKVFELAARRKVSVHRLRCYEAHRDRDANTPANASRQDSAIGVAGLCRQSLHK